MNKPLKAYENSDYILQLRARFLFCLCIISIVATFFVLLKAVYGYLAGLVSGPLPIPLIVLGFIMYCLCLALLVRGYYFISANIILVMAMGVVWYALMGSPEVLVRRIDGIGYALAVLAMVPLLITRNRYLIFVYTAVNIGLLVIFAVINQDSIGVHGLDLADLIVDFSVSMLLIGFVGFYIFYINKAALDRVEAELKERRDAEEALRQSEERLRSMAENIPGVVFQISVDGKLNIGVNYVGDHARDLFGIEIHPLDTFFDRGTKCIHPDDLKSWYDSFLNAVHNRAVWNFEGRYHHPDGREIWIRIIGHPDCGKDVIVYNGIALDVTDRKISEIRLRESEELFKTMVESNPNPVSLSGMDGRLMLVNDAFAKITGEPKETITGKTMNDLGLMSLEFEYEKTWNELNAAGRADNYEVSFADKDGKVSYQLIFLRMINVKGTPAVLSSSIDITGIKKLEHRLRESEDLYRTMINKLPYPVAIVDMENKYMFANTAYLETYHLKLDEIIGRSSLDVGFVLDSETVKVMTGRIIRDGKFLNIETEMTIPGNEKTFVFMSGDTMAINGMPCVILATVDISERKALESKLREYTQKLEVIVEERTKDLQAANEELQATIDELHGQRQELELALVRLRETQEQVILSEKMATLGILTSGVAHEINNPVNYIYNGVVAMENYLEEHAPGQMPDLMPLLAAINTGISRTVDIVKSLNRYSRNDNQVFSQCNIHEILDNCLTMLANQYKNRIMIVKEFAGGIPEISASEGRLQQAFVNIVTNAIQAIDGKGTITIRTRMKDKTVEISIADTGTGISEENMRHIYDPFFTTKPPGKGTGLGLSITQTVIQEHGGTIRCSSRPGEGTEFIIDVPVNR